MGMEYNTPSSPKNRGSSRAKPTPNTTSRTMDRAVDSAALAMAKAAESTALSMVREVVFGVGFALLLPRFFGLDGVLYSMPMSDILTFLIAGYLICKTYRELNQKGEV